MSMRAASSGMPILILKEGSGRTRGRTAQQNNIMASRIVCDVLKSTLGPRGMDKMLVDGIGDVTITNDGATVLKEIDVQHPAAKMLVEAAKTQDNMVGDGTTTVVILAGELLKGAVELLDQNVHPTIIVSGFKKAADKAHEVLKQISIPVNINESQVLKKVAMTAMGSKSISSAKELLADVAIEAIRRIAEKRGEKWAVDIDQIQVTKKSGGSVNETKLLHGLIIDKEVVHSGMPKKVSQARIALIDTPLEIEKTEISAEIRIRDPTQMKAFLDEEANMMREMVEKLKKTGANVVFCQKGIDDIAQHYLAKDGILAVRRVKKSDMEKLARATGGRVVNSLDDLGGKDIGYANEVEERKLGTDKMTFVEGCKDPHSVAVLIRGGLDKFVDEAERSFHDALFVVADVYDNNQILAGGGAPEAEVAKQLREYATKVGGREQLAIEVFADAFEAIPRTLAENAGLDPIDILVSLRAAHEKPNGATMGVDVLQGITDTKTAGILEPLKVKEQAIRSAVEVASMMLRIDDVIIAAKSRAPPMPSGGPGGMPPGMGGMGGMY